TKLDPWYTEDPRFVTLYPYNPRKAQQILEELGWKIGASGVREKDGKKLSLEFATVADVKLSEMMAVWTKDSFKKIGVDLQIKLSPARIFFSEVITKRKFQLAAYTTIFSPDWNPRAFFDPDGIPSEKNGFSGFNGSGLKNLELSRLLAAAEMELDAPKRIPLMRQAVKIITEENPYIPLYYRNLTAVVPLGLKNFSMSPHSSTEFYEIENWQFAKAP
ncbi:MAG: ABC transporter substrate-binding protein, partial [Bdellovibrio sp.]